MIREINPSLRGWRNVQRASESITAPSTPGLPASLAVKQCRMLPSGVNRPWAESDRKQGFRSSIPFRALAASPCLSSSLPFCLRSGAGFRPVGLIPALQNSLAGPVASGYPGGIPSRSSSNHFQSAHATDCYHASSRTNPKKRSEGCV